MTGGEAGGTSFELTGELCRGQGLDEAVSAVLARPAMRRRLFFISLTALLAGLSPAFAQSDERDTLLGVNLAGPLFGIYSGSFQQLLQNDLSIFVRGTYFDPKWGVLYQDLVPEERTYWSADGEIGFNYYPQDSAPSAFYAGLGVSPGYLFLRDQAGKEAAGFSIGVVTQVGYQFVWGPIAVGPRASMGYQWVLAELGDLDMEATLKHEIGIRGAVSGFWLGAGLDLSIAF